MKQILQKLLNYKKKGHKAFAVLIDPDKIDLQSCSRLVNISLENKVDFFLVGGSLVTVPNLNQIIRFLKSNSNIPVIIFPGNNLQIDTSADGILFLSLISGRNPEFLIGQHVIAAPILKKSSLEIIPTGYVLVDSGQPTTVQYMSNTIPIPYDKPTVAACTAMAGELLGLKLIYLEAGSGAKRMVSNKMISMVRKSIDIPLIVGGGITSARMGMEALEAGADMIVIGNGIEKDFRLLIEVSERVAEYNSFLEGKEFEA